MRVGYAVVVSAYRGLTRHSETKVAHIRETTPMYWLWSDELVYRATL